MSVLACAFVVGGGQAADAEQAPEYLALDHPPPGFEQLARPQKTLVDVYYGDRFLLSTLATYTPTGIELENPDTVVKLISDIRQPEVISKALSDVLPTNTEFLCDTPSRVDCGTLEPEVAGVLFDESRFRLDLFINRRFLELHPFSHGKYLPSSDSDLALLQNFSGLLSGTEPESGGFSSNYTLYGHSFFSRGENHLEFGWDLSRDRRMSVNTLLAEREYEGACYRLGLIRSSGFGLTFSPSQTLLGGYWANSENTRIDQSLTQGTPLIVFLPVRGRVDILKDGRLIASFSQEAGNQQLDTSGFPMGAYDLVVQVRNESGGLISEETRFFAKQLQLPPEQELQYFVEAGQVTETTESQVLPELKSDFLFRGGINYRLLDNMAGTLSAAASQRQALLEGGVFYLHPYFELSPGLMISSHQHYGLRLNAQAQWQALSAYLSYLQFWRDHPEQNRDAFFLPNEAFRQLSLSVNCPLKAGHLYARFNNSDRNQQSEDRYSLGYRLTIFRDISNSVELRLDYSFADSFSGSNQTGLAAIEWRFDSRRQSGNWRYQVTPEYYHDQSGNNPGQGSRLRVAADYDNLGLSGALFEARTEAEKSADRHSLGGRMRYLSHYGQAGIDVRHVEAKTGQSTGYSANFATSIITNGQLTTFGGNTIENSTLAVEVSGVQDNHRFDVYVNGYRRDYVSAQAPSLINLPAYHTYHVSLQPTGEAVYALDENERRVTLYPGNVVSLKYQVKLMIVVFGRVWDEQGKIIQNAAIEGARGVAVSDQYGLFQAEVLVGTHHLLVEADNRRCHLDLEGMEPGQPFVNLGDIVCKTP
ncbi:MAG: CS1-pili formation C-terminal domain-containing protein [Endozoicomonas sp.]